MYGRLLTFSLFLILLEKGKVCKVAIFSLLLASAKPHAKSKFIVVLYSEVSGLRPKSLGRRIQAYIGDRREETGFNVLIS